VKRPLPFFSPVAAIRFQPVIVPRASAIATKTLTQLGTNFVGLSSDFL
jgi:hypothetical protein